MADLTHVSTARFPKPQTCAECHVEIYSEWEHSPHAVAFANDEFRRATDNYRFTECIGCHAPQPILAAGEPTARDTAREAGVACVSCHLSEGAMVGPLQPTGLAKPHPIRVDPAFFAEGTLCGRCHQSTLAQWQVANTDQKQDCRQCHMPKVIRKITQATDMISKPLVAAETAALEHRHVFSLSADGLTDGPCTLKVNCADRSEATITLVNRLPHNLPTGDFGVRIIHISATGIDAHGVGTVLGHWELTRAAGGALAGGQSRSWRVELPPDVRMLCVEVVRQGRESADRTVLLRKEVAVP